MGRIYDRIDDRMAQWLVSQPLFFVATAPEAPDGLVNCSPKGNRNELVVIDGRNVAYLDQTGSGVETIAHLRDNGRILLMFCAFQGPPRIVRLHGRGQYFRPGQLGFVELAHHFPGAEGVGVRSIVTLAVERVADSCGYGVPLMSFDRHRPTMNEWSARKGPDGIRDYQAERNTASIGGLDALDGLAKLANPRTTP